MFCLPYLLIGKIFVVNVLFTIFIDRYNFCSYNSMKLVIASGKKHFSHLRPREERGNPSPTFCPKRGRKESFLEWAELDSRS